MTETSAIKTSQILIVQTAFLGDLLLGIPFFRELKKKYPDAQLVLLCRKGLRDVILKTGFFSEVIEVDKDSTMSRGAAWDKLKSRTFQSIWAIHQSPRTAFWVARLKSKMKVGYRNRLTRFLYNKTIPRPMHLPEALRQLALLAPFDSDLDSRIQEFAQAQSADGGQKGDELLAVPDWATMRIPDFADSSREKQIVLSPGSVWPTKRWTPEGFADLANRLMKSGYKVVLTGTPGEVELCRQIAANAPGVTMAAGTMSIVQTMETIAKSEAIVCNDSGAMHMASVVGTPSIAIFGPTVLEFGYRPWQTEARVVQIDQRQLTCRPCGKHGAKVCPIGSHDCMKMISAERVASVVADIANASI